jgi:polar amino acid transport system substrate-binding protein
MEMSMNRIRINSLSRRSLLQICSAGAVAVAIRPELAQAQQETTWQRILRTKSVRVACVGTERSAMVNLDGTFTGISPEILRQVLAPYGDIKLVPVQMDFDSMIPALIANRVDIVANTLSIRKARCAQIAFGNPEFNAREGIVVMKGNPKNLHSFADIAKNKDAKLGCIVGGWEATYAEIAGIPKERVLEFPDQALGTRTILDGRIDAFATIRFQLVGILEDINNPNLELAEPFSAPLNAHGVPNVNLTAAGFRKGDNDFREAYNHGLADLIASGKLLTIIKETTGGNQDDMPTPGVTAEEACDKQ